MHDIVIRGGTILDGTGAPAFAGDVAIDGERIVAVGGKAGPARRVIEADGLLVTPGWVDVHTHYDGQATWDPVLAPSSWHGVTTILFGNCGVGFAPVRQEHRNELIDLMEAVEDIPGTALSRRAELGVGELSRISRRAGPDAAHDRCRGADPAPSAARLCDGRARHRPRGGDPGGHRHDAPADRGGAARRRVRLHDLAHLFAQDQDRRTRPGARRRGGRADRHRPGDRRGRGRRLRHEQRFRGRGARIRLDDAAVEGDRAPGVVPADRPADRPGALAAADARRAPGARRGRRRSRRRSPAARSGSSSATTPR